MSVHPVSLVWHRRRRNLYAIGLALAVGALFVLPDEVLYARGGFVRWLPVVLIFAAVPGLVYGALKHSGMDMEPEWMTALAAGAGLSLLFALAWYWGEEEDARFRAEGVVVPGIVSEHWQRRGRHGHLVEGWSYRAHYTVGGMTYIASSDDDQLDVTLGDTIRVEYLRSKPVIGRPLQD